MEDVLIGAKFSPVGQNAKEWQNFASGVQPELTVSIRNPERFHVFEGVAVIASKWRYLHRLTQNFQEIRRDAKLLDRELATMQKSAQEFRRVYYGPAPDAEELANNYVQASEGTTLDENEDPMRDHVDIVEGRDSRNVRPQFLAKLRKRLTRLFDDPMSSSDSRRFASVLAFPVIVNGEAYAACDVVTPDPTEFVPLSMDLLDESRKTAALEFLEDVVFAMVTGPQRYLDVNVLVWKQWMYVDGAPSKFQLLLTGQFYGSIEAYYEALLQSTVTFQTPQWILDWKATGIRPRDDVLLLGCLWQVFSFLALSSNNLSKYRYSDKFATYDPNRNRSAEFYQLVEDASKATPFLRRAYRILMDTNMNGAHNLTDANDLIRRSYVRYALAPRVRRTTAERFPDPIEEDDESDEEESESDDNI